MANGGARPGAGAPKGSRNAAKRPIHVEPVQSGPRPVFKTAQEFAIWALNAPDAEVPMDLKLRAMQVMAPLEAKQAAEPAKKAPAQAAEESMGADGVFAPRRVRGFGQAAGTA